MFDLLKRIIFAGWTNFKRQSALNIATIFILVLTISLVTSFFLLQQVSQSLISIVQEKVDITAYFKPDCSEQEILEVQEKLSQIPEIKDIEYISKDEALKKFKERYKNNPLIMESLEMVGINPFLAALNIRAKDIAQYKTIADFLEDASLKNSLDHTDYYKKEIILEKLSSIVSKFNKAAIALALFLGLIAVLVAFNTIRLTIYGSKEEIGIMRLVGSSNWFIRGPFIFQGVICGISAALISFLIFVALCYFSSEKLEILIPGLDIFNYFTANLLTIFSVQLAVGIGIGVFSSVVAIRKYLRV